MKKFLTIFLLFNFIYLLMGQTVCFAGDKNKIIFKAERINKKFAEEEIDKKVLEKYMPIKINVSNKSDGPIFLSNQIFYVEDGKIFKIPNSTIIFNSTKRHTVRRAFLIGIPVTVLTLGILTVPSVIGSITYTVTTNGTMEDNIKRANFKKTHIFEKNSYSAYVFIPNKHKNATDIIIKNVDFENDANNEIFDLKTIITDETL
ncbi:MAG: hypothetical protein V2B14_01875 [bacterium]